MHVRMQSLYPTIHHLWKACDFFNADDRNAFTPQRFRRPTGGDDFPTELDELTREVHDSAFVRY